MSGRTFSFWSSHVGSCHMFHPVALVMVVTPANCIQFYGSCMQMNALTHSDIRVLLQISVYLRLTLAGTYTSTPMHFNSKLWIRSASYLSQTSNDKCNTKTIQSGNEMSKGIVRRIRSDEFYSFPAFLTDLSNPLFMSDRELFPTPQNLPSARLQFHNWFAGIFQHICAVGTRSHTPCVWANNKVPWRRFTAYLETY